MVKKHLYGFIGILGSMMLVSCAQQQEHPTDTSLTELTGIAVKDTLPAPVVTYLSDFEPPTVIKAAEPIYDSLSTPFGEGIPDITRYTTLDGLPQSITYRVLQGAAGIMWFLSVENLSKFDGTSFTTYNRANGLLEDAYSNEFLLDSEGKIWVSNNDGITVFDGRSFTTYTTDGEGNEIGEVESIIADNDGSLWMASTENGLFRFKNNQITRFTTDDGLKSNQIEALLVDKEGLLLITTNDGISQYDGTSITSYEAIPEINESEGNNLLFTDTKGNIWFHSGAGNIGSYDGNQVTTYSPKEIFNDVDFFDAIEDENGDIWFATSKGIAYFDGAKFFHYSNANLGISKAARIFSIAFDQEGSLWAVIPTEGVIKINRNLSFPEIPGGDQAFDVIPDPTGDIWIQTSKGFGKYLENRIAFYGHELLADANYSSIQTPVFDRNGILWFTLKDERIEGSQLVKFDGTHFTMYGPEQGLLLEDCGGWQKIVNNSGLLQLICNNTLIVFDGTTIARQNFLPDVELNSFLEDMKGNRWYGTENNGLFKYDGEQLFKFSTKTGLVSNKINRLTEDPLGNIWVAIDYGNARITNTTLSSFDAQDGLANLVGIINPDTVNDVLWFGTISGLVSLDFAQLNDEDPGFIQYNYLTGFSIGPVVEPKPDIKGRIWGISRNIFLFNYPALSDLPETTPYIKNIQINNQSVSWLSLSPSWAKTDSMAAINEMGLKFKERLSDEQLEVQLDMYGGLSFDSVPAPDFVPVNLKLPYANNTISFEFASVSPTYGKSIQYQYRLEGYNERWSPLSTKKEANFGNLPEGRYTFQVKALNTAGNWSEISYPFTVHPPWFRSWLAYLIYVFGSGFAVFGFISWRTRSLNREKIQLEDEVSNRTSELNQSLENLKSTQSQLIQAEKMASLGELTAGIAHEIQNPLNFVNNFSEVSGELVDEMNEELEKGDIVEAKVIGSSLKENLSKINHHGKRADTIVKGMLAHSRTGKGEKRLSNLNILAEEYLKLSYHGLRARDKSFNADFKTDFDATLPKIEVIPQDIGRVLLNLINNAFQATSTEALSDLQEGSGKGDSDYRPLVTVSTKNKGGSIEISVKDNGPGIPEAIREKIFQPFFTTKPTGQGTGLGLSLSYDIVKAHGGELKVETKEKEGSEFIISLPV